jgi:hypothetical protein
MKNVLILVAVVLVAAGAYWKFRGSIHGKIEEVKKAEGTGTGSAGIVDAAKSVIPAATTATKTVENLPLATAEFIRGLPGSLTAAPTGTKADVVIELTVADESGAGLPAQIQLSPNVSLDTSAIQMPAGAKDGTMVLVHLQSAGPAGGNVTAGQTVVQATAEPVPPSLESGIRGQNWRATVALPFPAPSQPKQMPYFWATEFARREANNELDGAVIVEGTFGSYSRASGNAQYEFVTLEEAKNIKFHFGRGSVWQAFAVEADKLKKKGHRVTFQMTVDVSQTPKYTNQDQHWCIPLKAQYEYWNGVVGGKKRFATTLALAAWAEERGLGDEAKAAYEMASTQLTRETLSDIGRPTQGIRIHLADQVDDLWSYGKVPVVSDPNHHPIFEGKPIEAGMNFQGAARPFWAALRTNPNAATTVSYQLMQK